MDQTIPNSEFPRSIDVSDLPSHGLDISVQATLAEREALCQRFELVELRALEAHRIYLNGDRAVYVVLPVVREEALLRL